MIQGEINKYKTIKGRGKKILGFDMDGVLVDNNPLKLKIAQNMGYKIKLADTPSEIIKQTLSPEDMKSLQVALYHDLEMSLGAELMPGLTKLLDKIRLAQTPYFLISRRSEPAIAIELLKVRGLWPKYFNESNAFFVITPEDKNTKAKELGVTHYVDDETKVLVILHDVPNKFLFDHLSVFPEHESYTKVASHGELAKYFL